MGAELFHAVGRTDRQTYKHYETNSSVSQFRGHAYKRTATRQGMPAVTPYHVGNFFARWARKET